MNLYENEKLNITVTISLSNIGLPAEYIADFFEMFSFEEKSSIDGLGVHIFRRNSGLVVAEIYQNSKLKISHFDNDYIEIYVSECSYMIARQNTKLIVYYNQKFGKFRMFDSSEIFSDGASIEVMCRNNSRAYLCANEGTTVYGFDNSTVKAQGRIHVRSSDHSTINAMGDCFVLASGNSIVKAKDAVNVKASDQVSVFADDKAVVYASGDVSVTAHAFSTIYKENYNVTIKKENHFGVIFDQVFKLEEDIIAYKKLNEDRIAVLKLEKGQIFQSKNHGKCRTDRAIVLSIESIDGKTKYDSGESLYNRNFKYVVGETVQTIYDENITECSSGIHFYLTREKAESHFM